MYCCLPRLLLPNIESPEDIFQHIRNLHNESDNSKRNKKKKRKESFQNINKTHSHDSSSEGEEEGQNRGKKLRKGNQQHDQSKPEEESIDV
jgi:hypothetical protein